MNCIYNYSDKPMVVIALYESERLESCLVSCGSRTTIDGIESDIRTSRRAGETFSYPLATGDGPRMYLVARKVDPYHIEARVADQPSWDAAPRERYRWLP